MTPGAISAKMLTFAFQLKKQFNMIKKNLLLAFVMLATLCVLPAFAQEEEQAEGYTFTVVKENPSTTPKNQYKSGTCWSFASLGLVESELLRMGKDTFDLSEMFVVRHSYDEKARRFVRMHGNMNFGAGGGFSDWLFVWKEYGIVPESVYHGLEIGEDNHMHGEMDAVLTAYVKAIVKNPNKKLSPVWLKGYNGILDAYLGDSPVVFEYNGKVYTPRSFADELGINPDDYYEITSFTHHPFYSEFILEIPDNWLYSKVYNVPLDEMIEIIDYAIEGGYTVAWASDVSDKGFSWTKGVAIIPEADLEDMGGTERERWEKLTDAEKQKQLYSFDGPGTEKTITQELRQQAFDNYETTDDHGMQITGIANDQEGNKYYIVKNSWGLTGNDYKGFFYASGPFVRLKTTSLMVHKDAIPEYIREKLGIE
jgi:bleomycin hydrolase